MTFTVEQLKDQIDEYAKREHSGYRWGSHLDLFFDGIGYGDVKLNAGKIEYVDTIGGEDQGSRYRVIFKIGDRHFCAEGTYNSWDGTDFEYYELTEVEPYQETITEYREVQ
jgi:hypothetical protein